MSFVRATLLTLALWPGLARAQWALAPECLSPQGRAPSEVALVRGVADEELLARLAYAEGLSTGFPDDPLVYRAIAWGVMNRVRLAEASPRMARQLGRGIKGVVFKRGQFNPAVSPRSPFARDFLCPAHAGRWEFAVEAAREAIRGEANPFLSTEWERQHGLSLVINFYYPASSQARGRPAPWERSGELELLEKVSFGEGTLKPERVRFYRLARPPSDVPAGP